MKHQFSVCSNKQLQCATFLGDRLAMFCRLIVFIFAKLIYLTFLAYLPKERVLCFLESKGLLLLLEFLSNPHTSDLVETAS